MADANGTPRTCSVEGCEGIAHAKGLCGMHYQRLKRLGSLDVQRVSFKGAVCSVDGCGQDVLAKGLCSTHYERVRRRGTLELTNAQKGEPLAWLREFVRGPLPETCVKWPFSTITSGYGCVWVGNVHYRAHRYIYEVYYGESIGDKLVVRHTCGNGHLGCVNPKHLALGTQKDNAADAMAHGTIPLGENRHNAKLTRDSVLEIRGRAGNGETDVTLAAEFGVRRESIRDIRLRKRWKWLE